MNDDPRKPIERELIRRMQEERPDSEIDDAAIEAASSWLPEIDGLVESASNRDEDTYEPSRPHAMIGAADLVGEPLALRGSETELDQVAESDREAVLARIGERPSSRPQPLPWWRIAAPIAVAAGLAGLFILRDQTVLDPSLPPPPTVSEELRQEAGRARAGERFADEAEADAPAFKKEAVAVGTLAAQPSEILSILDQLGDLDAPRDLAVVQQDSLIERLRALRPTVADDELGARADRWLQPRQ